MRNRIDIISDYKNGYSLSKLAKIENVSRWEITKIIKSAKIKIINRWNISKFNENIFDSIDTEEKAYWLGFIYADGYIANIENKKAHYTFEISLCEKDTEHLYKFNKFVGYNGENIKISKSKIKDKVFGRCRWCVTNKHLWTILNNYGCTPNKSLTLNFPKESIFKSKNLIRHFIRGYFDGDGCFSQHICKTIVSPNISIIGTKQFLIKIGEYSGFNINFLHDKRHSNETWIIYFSLKDTFKFLDYIYNNSTVYLKRKYLKYTFFKQESRSPQEWENFIEQNR